MEYGDAMQPLSMSKDKHCVAMVLLNYMDPQWLSVDCQKNLTFFFICKVPMKKSIQSFSNVTNSRFCKKQGISVFSKCMDISLGSTVENCTDIDHIIKITKGQMFWFSEALLFFQQWRTEIKAPKICFYEPSAYNLNMWKNTSTFTCSSGEVISSVSVCDGIIDCKYRGDDEARCGCQNSASSHCSHCMNNFALDLHGVCRPMSQLIYRHMSQKQVEQGEKGSVLQKLTQCQINEYIPGVLEKDSIPDCFNGAEESADKATATENIICVGRCKSPTAIPCFSGDKHCFFLHELCIYELHDVLGPGFLKPCRNGKHLANCSAATCPHHFKCSSSYCIPIRYTCDGKQDCPVGNDEQNCHNRTCQGQFKCKLLLHLYMPSQAV